MCVCHMFNKVLAYLLTYLNFALLTPVKIRGWVGEIFVPIVEALPTTEPPEYIRWPSTARLLSLVDLIKKEKRERKFIGKT